MGLVLYHHLSHLCEKNANKLFLAACGENERWTSCGMSGAEMCDKPNPDPAKDNCFPGCECIDNYKLEMSSTPNVWHCVPGEKCPKKKKGNKKG